MTTTGATLPSISDVLRRDLALVLPELLPPPNTTAADIEAKAAAAAEQLDACAAPAIVGLAKLSIEAARWAVALAERVRGKILPWPLPIDLSSPGQSVTQTATLGHLFASDLVIWVGCTGGDGPIAQAIAARQLHASFVEADLDTVQRLRAEVASGKMPVPAEAKRVGVVLSPACDPRVAGQWHKLAAQVQEQVRMAVVRLPDIGQYQNMRGVLEVILWQTGLSCAGGGVDFSDGAPRPCGEWGSLRDRHAVDFILEPAGLFAPCAARVMRFDGVILWLCDDPMTAPPDPTALYLEAICRRVKGHSGASVNALRIINGKIYDPANGVDGRMGDLLIAGGKLVAALDGPARTIDAAGMVVMPGGIDIHCHIASTAVNRARAMQGEEHATHVHHARCIHGHDFRAGSGVLTPSTCLTGYRYAAMGYTSAIEAAVSPTGARQTHLELADTPNLDVGFLLLLANHQNVIEMLDRRDDAGAAAFVAHLLRKTGAYGIKVVNPGGVASWRNDARHHTIESIDDRVAGSNVTPRRIIELMAGAAESLNLPHAPHIHCNRLGLPGNVETTLATLAALDGRRVHLTHLQFHAYGKTAKGGFTSAAARLCEYFNDHPHATADVGQVMFGDAFTLTGDTPLEHLIWKLTGKRYVSIESELETGCGLMPFHYSDKQHLHSLQWAIGLELMLMNADPWRMLLSTDHPNGGSFLTYPAIIASLMSKARRNELIAKAHPRAMRDSRLKDLTREFTLNEIAIATRAGPARVLGLKHKGHLGPGADADVTVYPDLPSDPQQMFESPRYVVKSGHVLVEDGELRAAVPGGKFCAAIAPNERGEQLLRDWFDRHGSYDVSQFGLHEHELAAIRPSRK